MISQYVIRFLVYGVVAAILFPVVIVLISFSTDIAIEIMRGEIDHTVTISNALGSLLMSIPYSTIGIIPGAIAGICVGGIYGVLRARRTNKDTKI